MRRPDVLRVAVHADAMSVVLASSLTAAAGFAFWAVAARILGPHTFGVQSALLSGITTAGTVGAGGMSNAFVALLPHSRRRWPHIRSGYLLAAVLATIISLPFAVVWSHDHSGPHATALSAVIVVGSAVTAVFSAKDAAQVALGAARRLPLQNAAISALKLLLLLALWSLPFAAVSATLASTILAVTVIGVLAVRRLARGADTGADSPGTTVGFRTMASFGLRDGVAGAISLGLVLAMPFLVATGSTAAEAGVIALAIAMTQTLDLVGYGVATSVTTHMAQSSLRVATVVRITVTTLAIVLLGAIGLVVVAAPALLSFIGGDYDRRGILIATAVLAAASILRVPHVINVAILRARRRVNTVVALSVVGFVVGAPVAATAIPVWGSLGGALGMLAAAATVGTVSTTMMVRNLRHHSRDAGSSIPLTPARDPHPEEEALL